MKNLIGIFCLLVLVSFNIDDNPKSIPDDLDKEIIIIRKSNFIKAYHLSQGLYYEGKIPKIDSDSKREVDGAFNSCVKELKKYPFKWQSVEATTSIDNSTGEITYKEIGMPENAKYEFELISSFKGDQGNAVQGFVFGIMDIKSGQILYSKQKERKGVYNPDWGFGYNDSHKELRDVIGEINKKYGK
jgi:hypothetical protein